MVFKRSSVVNNVSWFTDESRALNKDDRKDFIGKCEIVYPAFIDFLRRKREEKDLTHDHLRRRLYDVLHFRKDDDDLFKERVLNAVSKRAFSEKVLAGMPKVDHYYLILHNALNEAESARKLLTNEKK